MPNLIIIPSRALDDAEMPAPAFRVLCAIGTFTGPGGANAFPSVKTLAAKARTDPRDCRRHLQWLVAHGYIESAPRTRENGASSSNVYDVLLDDPRGAGPRVGGVQHPPPPGSSTPPPSMLNDPPERPSSTIPLALEVVQARDTAAEVVAAWNAMAEVAGLPKARATDRRRELIRARLRDGDWLADFGQACTVVAASTWHRGDNPSGWVATIDYLLQRGKATELAERAKAAPQAAPKSRGGARAAVDSAHLERLQKDPTLGTLTKDLTDVRDDLEDVFES